MPRSPPASSECHGVAATTDYCPESAPGRSRESRQFPETTHSRAATPCWYLADRSLTSPTPAMRTQHALALALALSIAACGSGSCDAKEAGYQALQSGDFEGAVTSFEEALATRSMDDADYVEVAVGHCQALAHVDAAKTKTTFLALGDHTTDKDYSIVVAELVSESEFEVAIEILAAGVARFPNSPKMQQVKERVGKTMEIAIQESANPEATKARKAIEAMGYTSGGD